MSKNKKFKKFSKAQILSELNRDNEQVDNKKEQIDEIKKVSVDSKISISSTQYNYVRKDLKKDFVILLVIFVILTGLIVVNNKTNYLIKLSDDLAKILNINQ